MGKSVRARDITRRSSNHLPFVIFHLSFQTNCMDDQARHSQAQADQLEGRLIDFAVRIVRLSSSLPRTPAGKHIASQILRSGTSPAPNYGEARGAESHADFVHKLRIVLKELNETSIWLRVIDRSQLVRTVLLVEITKENKELCKIFTASLKTARTPK
jgi:four helix bundle protein